MAGQIEKGARLGQYEIIEPLGKGGMASVYRAHQPSLDREVAIKVIAQEYAHDPDFAERFRREEKSIARLRHPNILTVYDAGEENGLLYLVMELIEGQTLKEKINGRPLPVDEAIHYTTQIASALDYANKNNIIHRDVKPSNVLIDKDDRAVLSDFGIAKLAEQNMRQLTSTGTGVGTPDYMSPEQALGETVDARSDQYSLAVMSYELLTGRPPYNGDTPIAIVMGHVSKPLPSPRLLNPDIPLKVEQALAKALSKKAADRYETSAAFSRALLEANRSGAVESVSSSASTHVARPTPNYNPQAGVTPTDATLPISSSYFPSAPGVTPYTDPQQSQRYSDALGQPTPLPQNRPAEPYNYAQNNWQAGAGYAPTGSAASAKKSGFPLVPVVIGAAIILIAALAIILILALGGSKDPAPNVVASATAPPAPAPTVTPAPAPTAVNPGPPPPGGPGPGRPPVGVTPGAPPVNIAPTLAVPTFRVVPPPNGTRPGTGPGPGGLKFKPYKDPNGKWTAEVPDNWEVEVDKENNTITFSGLASALVVVSEDLGPAGADPATVDLLVKGFLQGYGAKIDRQEKRRVNGVDVTFYVGTFTASGVNFNLKMATVIKDDRIYLVLSAGLPNADLPANEAFERFLATFKTT